MFQWLMAYGKGSVKIHISGVLPERFLNLCAGIGLELCGLCDSCDGYTCTMSVSDYKEARRLARKCRVSLHIMKKSGLPFFIHKNRKRKAYVIGMGIGFCILYVMSLRLWDIQFEGNQYYTDDVLMTFLENNRITHGRKMDTVHCDEIEQAMRNRYSNITWVSAQISGTRLIIQIKENFGLMKISDPIEGASDLIAPFDGEITEIITKAGIPCVKVGDRVKKGDILVSGKIPIKNDAGERIGYQTVAADADIKAAIRVDYQKDFSIFKETNEVVSSAWMGFSLFWKDGSLNFTRASVPEKRGYTITEYYKTKLFSNCLLPIVWSKTISSRCQTRVSRLSTEEQQKIADQEFAYYLSDLKDPTLSVISDDRSITEGKFTFTDSGSFVIEQEFSKRQMIPEEEDLSPQTAEKDQS